MKYLFSSGFILSAVAMFIGFGSVAQAAPIVGISATITRGDDATISWVQSGGSGFCSGDFDRSSNPAYPASAGDGVNAFWVTNHAGNNSVTRPYYGDPTESFPQKYTFTCTDTSVPTAIGEATITINDCNPGDVWNTTTHTCAAASAPTVNAGIDRGVTSPPTSSVDISGATASDPDGIKSTVWSFVSGPGTPTISSGTTRTPRFSGLTVAGTYTFRLTVFDTLDTKGEDDMIVWVVNPPPTASFTSGATCVIPADMSSCTTPITFTSAYTDPAGVELTDCSGAVIWSAGSGAQTRTVSIPHSGSCYQIHKAPGGVKLSTDLIGIASCDPDALQHRVVADATVQRVTATDGRHVLASAGTQADM